MRYASFTSVTDAVATHIDEAWEDVVTRLLVHKEVETKESVTLFNGTVFGGSGRRLISTAIETCMLILDFDNAIKPNAPGYDKTIKKPVPDPVETYEVEALLNGREFVLVTSHSHTPEWPRFRVVLPIKTPVPMTLWKKFAASILDELGLTMWLGSIDDIYLNPTQPYFWPSCLPGAARYAIHGQGEWLQFEAGKVAATDGSSVYVERKSASGTSPFTPEQVAAFWAAELPESDEYGLYQSADGSEWRGRCSLHGGRNQKFYVNPASGKWHCKSKCDEPNKGGDIYKFVMLKYDVGFAEAKRRVHEITGDPSAEHTEDELAEAIETAHPEDVPTLVEAIAKQSKKGQKQLVEQLVTTHQLDREVIEAQIAEQTKVVRFERAGVIPPATPTEANDFGLVLSPERYEMGGYGVYAMRWVSQGQRGMILQREDKPLMDRPMWPGALGVDLATGEHYLQLSWIGSQGTPHSHWVTENTIRSRDALLRLDDAPLSLETVVRASAWLSYAKTCIAAPARTLATQASWYGEEGSMRFVMPCDKAIDYIGPDMELRGNVDGWCAGLTEILALGEGAYPALVALGLSAASPLSRFMRKRNPVVAFVAKSSSGKNKVIEYALSIWDEARKYRVPAESTTKGTQDLMKEYPDFPVFIDELQQLNKKDPFAIENMLYFAGDGQRRVTSSKSQKSVGGERRYGVSFMAAEHDVFQAIQQGAQNRVVALEGNPLPEGCPGAVLRIEYATTHNCGAVGRKIAALLNEGYLPTLAEVETDAWQLAETGRLRGDDPYTIALMTAGLHLLSDVTGLAIPAVAVHDWLVERLAVTRANAKDSAEDAFVYVLEALMGMPWEAGGNKDVLEDADGGIAWRLTQATNASTTPLEINPTHPKVVELLRRKNLKEAVAMQWGRKGWIHMNAQNPKRIRSTQGKTHSPGARAWRVTLEGLAQIGLDVDLNHKEG